MYIYIYILYYLLFFYEFIYLHTHIQKYKQTYALQSRGGGTVSEKEPRGATASSDYSLTGVWEFKWPWAWGLRFREVAYHAYPMCLAR